METYKQTLHSKMKLHHERHVYKRGKNKGDAPAGLRYKSDYRIIDNTDHMALRFYKTDILKAYPDGSITINCDGYADRPTTKAHLNEWLYRNERMGVGSRRIMSESQLVVCAHNKLYRYYDGISFDANGAPTTPLKPFRARRIDKDEVAELNKAIDENGFKEMFKVLWGAVTQEDASRPNRYNARWLSANDRTDVFSMPDLYADEWMGMVACFAFDSESRYNPDTAKWETKNIKRTPSAVWSLIMGWAKTKMYKTIETEVYELSK